MPTPFDGKIGLWHFKGDVVGEDSISELADTVLKWAPSADAIYVKTSDGTNWQGKFDSSGDFPINGPEDIANWVRVLGGKGLEFHAWAVIKGQDVAAEVEILAATCKTAGVKSLILDVEPYDGFWQGGRQDVLDLMSGLRDKVGPAFHIGISTDPRTQHYDTIFPDAWRPFVNSVHPQIYWESMERTPEDIISETYSVWGNYGLPIYPVLQGASTASSIKEAQDICRSVRGATGLSYWRLGVIGPIQFPVINQESVTQEIGPDDVLRRYGWEKIIAPGSAGHMDGTHIGKPSSEVFSQFLSVRGHTTKYIPTQDKQDRAWSMWVPDLPSAGTYEVSVFIPGLHNTSKEARYHIHGITGIGTELLVRLNQSRYSNQWVPLVVYDFEQGGGQVNLTDLTGESGREVAFSAIRWRQVVEDESADERAGFDPPVGTAEARLGSEVWPGDWFDATGFAVYYETVGAAYHTGADLNLNTPQWDTDRNAPVYASADGTVTYSAIGGGTWGHVIVIRHEPLADGTIPYTRYAHIHTPMVKEGDSVERGQQIATIGNAYGKLVSYHLHFDISTSGILETNPRHWPGPDRDAVLKHYLDPRKFILEHRPPGRT